MTREEFVAEIRRLTEDMEDVTVSELVDVSMPTIRRWKSGRNVPHEFMRKGIIENLKKEIAQDENHD